MLFACTAANCYSQVITFNPALTVTGYTFYTNDVEHLTTLQTIEQDCGPAYYVPSLHYSTTPVTINSFTFVPGYEYTVQINGSASAVGDLSTPSVPIYFGISLGALQPATNEYMALNPFPNPYPITDYAGSITVNGPLISPRPVSTSDMFGTWLTDIAGIGSFVNSTTNGSSSPSSQFISTSTTSTFNIEVNPVLGNNPGLIANNGCGGNENNVVSPTTSTITINSITIVKTAIVTASINGGSSVSFSGSTEGGGGTIKDAPGATVTVTVTGSGAPGGNYTTECNLSGVAFSTGSSSLLVTNGSISATFIMPASGSVTWTGNFQETASEGGGSISVK